ncbi:M13 family metallopeptidase [Pelomonas sp. KK5]|uniref:M13 family metallopeptidase n=1 Tax=Pelomonas sp. KK5 TaxID=1855730 RepID=UPI00097C5773|nr:M13 family metallopeptidase [Pelomonas sp. KK5]
MATISKVLCLAPLVLSLTLAGMSHAQTPTSGLDKSGFDSTVRIQDDLFSAVNGDWVKKTEIPADKSSYGTFIGLRDLSDQRVRTIVDELAKAKQKPGTVEQKIADFYGSYVDTAAIDKAGLAPLKSLLASIDAIKTPKDLAAWLGKSQGSFNTPVLMGVEGDSKDPTVYTALTWQGGLGMPDRDYYLKADDERMGKARTAYESYLTTLGSLSGDKDAAATAKSVIELERAIAEVHLPKVELRDPVKNYNPMTVAELQAAAPGIDWAAFFAGANVGANPSKLSVSQPSEVKGVAKLVADKPLAQWKAYLRLRVLDESADLLPQAYRDAAFAFHGAAITGTKEERPRWQKGIAELNGAMGEAVGKVYVGKYFPPAYKARMQELVQNLLATYKTSIDGLSWMSTETKAQAQDKLSKYMTKIGYPDVWRDYTKLVVKAGDPVGNRERAGRFEWERVSVRVGKKVDRTEWGMTPQTVNAYYNPSLNEIVFPAAILQPPFFDMAADDAVNYGAIGAVIGHEISHGFDDQGSQYDGDGKLRNWWTEGDRKAFEAIADKLVAQYDGYEPIPGKHVNGRLTLGENIADLSGLQIAYKAYKRSLNGKPAPVLDGYTGEQRFFLGWSQAWRNKMREARQLQLLTIDPHSPSEFRANGGAVNHDGFHEAFGTKAGDKMFKPVAERIRIW